VLEHIAWTRAASVNPLAATVLADQSIGLPGAGVGGVLEQERQGLSELGYPVAAGSWRSASHGAG
jgi:hypothetical protein